MRESAPQCTPESRAPGAEARGFGSPKPEPQVLFESEFKSVGTRTYTAQLKRAGTGNHFLVLTESRPDRDTDQIRHTRLLVFSEDFDAFRDLLRQAYEFIRDHPVPEDVRQRQKQFWSKPSGNGSTRRR